jgi:hypothetical protein
MTDSSSLRGQPSAVNGDAPKSAYQRPELRDLGHVSELTQSNTNPGTVVDFGGGPNYQS